MLTFLAFVLIGLSNVIDPFSDKAIRLGIDDHDQSLRSGSYDGSKTYNFGTMKEGDTVEVGGKKYRVKKKSKGAESSQTSRSSRDDNLFGSSKEAAHEMRLASIKSMARSVDSQESNDAARRDAYFKALIENKKKQQERLKEKAEEDERKRKQVIERNKKNADADKEYAKQAGGKNAEGKVDLRPPFLQTKIDPVRPQTEGSSSSRGDDSDISNRSKRGDKVRSRSRTSFRDRQQSQRLFPDESLDLGVSIAAPESIRTKDIASRFDDDASVDAGTMKQFEALELVNLARKKQRSSDLMNEFLSSNGRLVQSVAERNNDEDDFDFIKLNPATNEDNILNTLEKLLRASPKDIDIIKAMEVFVNDIQELERVNICSGKEIKIIGRVLRTLID